MAHNRRLSQFANVVGYDGGDIGIGTTNPDASLHIHNDDASSFDAIWMSGSTKRKNVIKVNNSDNLIIGVDENNEGSASNFRLQIDGSEKLRVDSSGRMLLGKTTAPTGLVLGNSLTAASSTGAEVVTFRSDTSVAVGDVCGAFVIGNSDTDGAEDHFVGMWGKVASTNGSMNLHFAAGRSSYEGDTPDVTIKSGGDVGINTTSNNDGAHFQHYQSEVRHQSFQSNNGDLAIVTDNNSNPAVYIKGTGTADLLKVVDNTTTIFNVKDGGNVEVNGNIVMSNSNGISFSATANANGTMSSELFDDYEEGTWTPTVTSAGSIGTEQYNCTYTKIGRLVTINGDIHALTNTTSSSNIVCGGLPYIPSGTSGEWSAVCHGERYSSSIIVAYVQYDGGWRIKFRTGVGSNNYASLTHAAINDNGTDNNLRFTLTYEVV